MGLGFRVRVRVSALRSVCSTCALPHACSYSPAGCALLRTRLYEHMTEAAPAATAAAKGG